MGDKRRKYSPLEAGDVVGIYTVTRDQSRSRVDVRCMSCGFTKENVRVDCLRIYVTECRHDKAAKSPDEKRLYSIWQGMKSRCFNPNHAAYHRYGGKGIVVCDEWLDFYEFYRWSKANGYESGLTIDREDSSKDYSPTNCRWITLAENSRGQSGTRWYEFRGGKYTISQIAEIVGIPAGTIYNRLYKGVPEDVAFVGSREEITLFMKGKNK